MTAPSVRWDVLLARAIDEGMSVGFERAHKHTDNPSREHLLTEIDRGIWEQLDAVLVFEVRP